MSFTLIAFWVVFLSFITVVMLSIITVIYGTQPYCLEDTCGTLRNTKCSLATCEDISDAVDELYAIKCDESTCNSNSEDILLISDQLEIITDIINSIFERRAISIFTAPLMLSGTTITPYEVTISDVNVYYTIPYGDPTYTVHMTNNGSSFKTEVSGEYIVIWAGSLGIVSGNSRNLVIACFVNGTTLIAESAFVVTTEGVNDYVEMVLIFGYVFGAGDNITFAVRNLENTADVLISNINGVILRVIDNIDPILPSFASSFAARSLGFGSMMSSYAHISKQHKESSPLRPK
jgi:hypothetical protein